MNRKFQEIHDTLSNLTVDANKFPKGGINGARDDAHGQPFKSHGFAVQSSNLLMKWSLTTRTLIIAEQMTEVETNLDILNAIMFVRKDE